jgi:D-amino peptidase
MRRNPISSIDKEVDMKKLIVLICVLVLCGSAMPVRAQAPLKVYISVDMEGIWGVVHGDHTNSTAGDYQHARKWMAEDVRAVVDGLFEAGATEVVVNDSHGGMRNILAEDFHPRASYISGTPKPLLMMEGVDATFAACIFVGYHARAGTAAAILDHTISSATVRAVKINGMEMPELGINGAIAGAFGVPVVMLSGDTETCKQAKAILGSETVTVGVKEAIGRTAARMLPREAVLRMLKDGAKEALAKRAKAVPLKLGPTLNFELEFQTSSMAELPLQVPQVKRLGARTVGFTSNDYLEGVKLLRALIALAGIQ